MHPPIGFRSQFAVRASALVLAVAVCIAGVGCKAGLVGDWHMVKAVPSKELLNLDKVRFNKDGTYSAIATVDGKTTQETGTYSFNGFSLALRPQAGGQRTYSAGLMGGTLDLSVKDRHIELRKGSK